MTKRALIIVDLQNDYFPGGKWTLTGIEAAAANAARLLQSARAAGHLVVHVRHESPKSDAAFFVAGSEGAAIAPQVMNQEEEHVVLKHQINAFRDTDLKKILDTNGIEEVVIAGAMSHMCVDAITRASVDFGYHKKGRSQRSGENSPIQSAIPCERERLFQRRGNRSRYGDRWHGDKLLRCHAERPGGRDT